MPSLYRCRTSLGEVAALFAATPPPRADWSAELWPGRTGLVVRRDGEERRIDAIRWGADLPAGAADFPRHRRSELWFRELWPAHAHLLAPEARCLIVVEEFALPDGPAGARTRTWYGFDNPPLFAWAGVWRASAGVAGYAGFLVAGDAPAPAAAMPAIVLPEGYDAWLGGDMRIAGRIARQQRAHDAMYREPTEAPWGADRSP